MTDRHSPQADPPRDTGPAPLCRHVPRAVSIQGAKFRRHRPDPAVCGFLRDRARESGVTVPNQPAVETA